MSNPKLSCLFLCLTFLHPAVLGASQGQEGKYYKLTSLDVGNLAITKAHVRLVAILRNSKDYDEVQVFTLDRGHVHIRANGVSNAKNGLQDAIEGDIADGTDDDPAAILKGTFRWEKGKLVQCNLESIRIRLRNASGKIAIAGGKLVPGPSRLLFLENKDSVTFAEEQSKGVLRITLVGATIEAAKFEIQKSAFTANLKSRLDSPPQFDVDLRSGNIAPAKAIFHLDSTKLAQPHSMNFFPGEQVSSDSVVFDNLSVEFKEGKTHLTIGKVSLAKPAITLKGYDNLPILPVESYQAHEVAADSQTGQLTYSDLRSTKAFAKPDPWELANRLNGAGVFAPEVLLPIANSDLRYVKLSDLMTLYKVLGINDQSKTTITGVIIQQDAGVITKIIVDTIPAKPPKDNVAVEHPICLFVGGVSGLAAGMAVDALLVEFPVAAGVSVWLTATSPLNPWMAGPSFMGTFAVSKTAVTFLGGGPKYTGFDGLAAGVAGHLASDYCEVLIAHMPNRYIIGQPDYVFHPVVFEGVSLSPDRLLEDELSIRYQLYLGRAIKTSTLRRDPRYREQMSALSSVLKTVRDNTVQVRDLNVTKQNEYADKWKAVEAIRRKEIDNHELGNLSASAGTKYAGDRKQAYDEQQREAQRRVTPGPSGQPAVPGAPPPQPYPGPSGSKPSPNTNCGAPNCISTTATVGHPK
jgi:hypothetical protein